MNDASTETGDKGLVVAATPSRRAGDLMVDLAGRAGGESGRPPGGNNTMTSPTPGMRQALPPTRPWQREVLDAQLTQCRRVDNSFTRERSRSPGERSRHCTGSPKVGVGPLSGALATSITFQANVHELAAAEAIIYGPPSTGREYARGVEHALLWAESATSGPPVPASSRPDDQA
jgi:hypothetical protein